jgi:hypothetical protein
VLCVGDAVSASSIPEPGPSACSTAATTTSDFLNFGSNDSRILNVGNDQSGFFNIGGGNAGYLNFGFNNNGSLNIGGNNTGSLNLGFGNDGGINVGLSNTGNYDLGLGNIGNLDVGLGNFGDTDIGWGNAGSTDIGFNCRAAKHIRRIRADGAWRTTHPPGPATRCSSSTKSATSPARRPAAGTVARWLRRYSVMTEQPNTPLIPNRWTVQAAAQST